MAANSAPWFGRILRWTRSEATDCRHPGGWETWHHQRRYEIIKVDRRTAEQGRSARGWHFTAHPDTQLDDPFPPWPGPRLGATLAAARAIAEVHILTPGSDRQPTNHSPNLTVAVAGGGAACRAEGTRTTVWPDPQQGRLQLLGDGAGKVLATITPLFTTTGLQWQPALAEGTVLAVELTWHQAVRAVQVAALDLPASRA